ncbi:MAG TPA: ribulokinase, partial [Caldithrix sp.]|nr:ribulokinase [Caldithrix sp.]
SNVLNRGEHAHQVLSDKAARLRAGESGLLSLDWNNGNRNVLTDAKLTGLLVGQTLRTTDYEIYRALVEATAFGARRIIEQMEKYGLKIDKVITCGGIAEKNPLVMQIYADILNRPMEIAGSPQATALGAAIFGAVAAGMNEAKAGAVEKIQQRVCKVKDKIFYPEENESRVYQKLYDLYAQLHDAFGMKNSRVEMYPVMKKLLEIKSEV